MKLVFKQDGKPTETYDFEPMKLLSVEAEAIEDLPGAKWDTFEEFGQMFLKGNSRAHRAALWICKRRLDPALRFQDLSYELGALRITFTDDEAARFIASIRENPDLDEQQKNYLIEILDLSVYEGEMSAGTDLKDQSPNSETGDTKSVTEDSLPDSGN